MADSRHQGNLEQFEQVVPDLQEISFEEIRTTPKKLLEVRLQTELFQMIGIIIDTVSNGKLMEDFGGMQVEWIKKSCIKSLKKIVKRRRFPETDPERILEIFFEEKGRQINAKSSPFNSKEKKELAHYALSIAHCIALQYLHFKRAEKIKMEFANRLIEINSFKAIILPASLSAPKWNDQNDINEHTAVTNISGGLSEILFSLQGTVEHAGQQTAKYYQAKQQFKIHCDEWSEGVKHQVQSLGESAKFELIEQKKKTILFLKEEIEKQRENLAGLKKSINDIHLQPLPEFPECVLPAMLFKQYASLVKEVGWTKVWQNLNMLANTKIAAKVSEAISKEQNQLLEKIKELSQANKNKLVQLENELAAWEGLNSQVANEVKVQKAFNDREKEHLASPDCSHPNCLRCVERKADIVFEKVDAFLELHAKTINVYQFLNEHNQIDAEDKKQFEELQNAAFPEWQENDKESKAYLAVLKIHHTLAATLFERLLPKQQDVYKFLYENNKEIEKSRKRLMDKTSDLNARFQQLTDVWHALQNQLPKQLGTVTDKATNSAEVFEFQFGSDYYTSEKLDQLTKEKDRILALPAIAMKDIDNKIAAIDSFLGNTVECELQNAGGESKHIAPGKTLRRIKQLKDVIKKANDYELFGAEFNFRWARKSSFLEIKNELQKAVQSKGNELGKTATGDLTEIFPSDVGSSSSMTLSSLGGSTSGDSSSDFTSSINTSHSRNSRSSLEGIEEEEFHSRTADGTASSNSSGDALPAVKTADTSAAIDISTPKKSPSPSPSTLPLYPPVVPQLKPRGIFGVLLSIIGNCFTAIGKAFSCCFTKPTALHETVETVSPKKSSKNSTGDFMKKTGQPMTRNALNDSPIANPSSATRLSCEDELYARKKPYEYKQPLSNSHKKLCQTYSRVK